MRPGRLTAAPSLSAILDHVRKRGDDMANATAEKLLDSFESYPADLSLGPGTIADHAYLEEGEGVEWVASTWIEPVLINLFVCKAPGAPDQVICTKTGDGGRLYGCGGTWDSIAEAKAAVLAQAMADWKEMGYGDDEDAPEMDEVSWTDI